MPSDYLQERDYNNEKEITGRIKHLYCSGDKFSAGIIKVTNGPQLDRDCRFNIRCKVSEDETITLVGVWERSEKYGWSFKASGCTFPMPDMTVDGLAEYLANEKAFFGIGQVKAKQLVDAFGVDFGHVLLNEPEKIQEIVSLSDTVLSTLQKEWELRAATNQVSVFLASFGLTAHQCRVIVERFGTKAQQILLENPYILCEELDGFGFLRTDAIALKFGVDKMSKYRIKTCIRYLLEEEANSGGHIWIDKEDLMTKLVATLYLDDINARATILECMVEMDKSILLAVGEKIMLASLAKQEIDIYIWLTSAGKRDNIYFVKEHLKKDWHPEKYEYNVRRSLEDQEILSIIDDVNDTRDSHAKLNDEQKASIFNAIACQCSFIAGSAGSGKSTVISSIMNAYKLISDTFAIAVATPTGKAARRLGQDGIFATTIHKLLGYDPSCSGFTYNSKNLLPSDIIIIDELSMCAVPLLYSLFQAVDWERTIVVLVGDYNQLPPIGPGNTLRDFVNHTLVPTHVLQSVYRNEGELKVNCNKILEGKLERKNSLVGDVPEWFIVHDREEPFEIIKLLNLLYTSQLKDWGYDPVEDTQIITPYNIGPLGVNRLNLELQRVWQKIKYGIDLPVITEWDKTRPRLMVGDKVMQTKNNNEIGLMNGTQGIVLDILDVQNEKGEFKPSYLIQWDDRSEQMHMAIGDKISENIILAYACTIHKVQGSQYPCVIAICHSIHAYMLSRNLLYTAVTRARKSAIIIGNNKGLRKAITTTTPMDRRTLTLARCNLDIEIEQEDLNGSTKESN